MLMFFLICFGVFVFFFIVMFGGLAIEMLAVCLCIERVQRSFKIHPNRGLLGKMTFVRCSSSDRGNGCCMSRHVFP